MADIKGEVQHRRKIYTSAVIKECVTQTTDNIRVSNGKIYAARHVPAK